MVKRTSQILRNLRKLMKNLAFVPETLHAYIVPGFDSHHNEYLSPRDKRRDYITGFTGSSGYAVITENQACLWTDGRYFLQAVQEMDENWTLMKEGTAESVSYTEWIGKNLPAGARIGADPWLVTHSSWENLENDVNKYGQELVAVDKNLVDAIWEDRPGVDVYPIQPLEIYYTGRTWKSKVREVIQKIKAEKAACYIVTTLDDIAYGRLHLFVDSDKVTVAVRQHLHLEPGSFVEIDIRESGAEGIALDVKVELHAYEELKDFIHSMVGTTDQGQFWFSPFCSQSIVSVIPKSRRLCKTSPITLMKNVKNPVELQGILESHIRDGAALCEFFSWLEQTVDSSEVDELTAVEKSREFRSSYENFVGLSFSTIASSGPNGAFVHYKPKEETCRKLSREEMFLLDSGAHYKDGTTDVTRTVHLGVPTDFQRECYTRVLKGHIAIRNTVCPVKTKGNQLDCLARIHLWNVGLDYNHGTGHGVGHYLNVHEDPIGIHRRPYPEDPGLDVGMVISNEPGYYQEGGFGIRIENLVHVVAASTNYNCGKFVTFEDLTFVPHQRKLIDPGLLTSDEVSYIDSYHTLCREKVGALLRSLGKTEALKWLIRETEPLG
ncbi:hypothetical protein QYM36_008048 [Artemia franciscana]|uniref:Xaa-Pro aminopeptidase 1 n=1 Tax=Artemia franciscana TaxID=6661 RepID=A0AA88IFZ7_ARTSF|nr:hypothetical protein QYM36_008048 [Artemia franciscana]